MKIGIITWFSYENYGTKLQAFALQKYLRNIGHEVKLINFLPPESYQLHKDNRSLTQRIKQAPKNKMIGIKTRYVENKYNKSIKNRYKKMDMFINKNCSLTNLIHNDNEYIDTCNSFDLLICGSDQIWNPNFYHKYYFADLKKITTPKISYAPSLGINEILPSSEEKLRQSLESFRYITARENKGAYLLNKITNKDIATVLDPTFLLEKNDWLNLAGQNYKSKNYVLCYFLTDNKNYWSAAKKFSKNHDMKLFIIPQTADSYKQSSHVLLEVGVDDFLGLIANAKYILTDSFHACVFSIIFNKQFYVFERFNEDKYSSQNSRINSLLEEFSLNDRLINYNNRVVIEKRDIDYTGVNLKLEKEVENSKRKLSFGLSYAKSN